jgi:N-methylhydantoinase A/oxoprolinase/acetone carboxylase beta subunit
MPYPTYRIGVDVGGTHTDAVILDGASVVEWHKAPTSNDVSTGIRDAIAGVLAKAAIPPSAVGTVMMGTTHFTNALAACRGLAEVAVVRAGLPASDCPPPLYGWPTALLGAIGGHTFLVHGGHEFNGRILSRVDPTEIDLVAEYLIEEHIRSVAISAVWSPVDGSTERTIAAQLQQRLPGLRVSLSAAIGGIGLIERENGAVLNATLALLAEDVITGLQSVMEECGVKAPLWITQNDGTLAPIDFVVQYPVFALGSGPTNSMRGGAFISGQREAIVVDVGGTTTDVGLIHNGFPRQATMAMDVAGVRTNFRMPDVTSIALGGGSIVRFGAPASVGSESVGYNLVRDALVFGGQVLTFTDIAVAAGIASIGVPARATHLPTDSVAEVLELARTCLEQAVDRAKAVAGDLPVILVGGGAVLIPGQLAGATEVLRHPHANVANAIGAALSQVSGDVDKVYSLAGIDRESILAEVVAAAQAQALDRGAVRESLRLVEMEEIPLGEQVDAVRVRAKVIGDLVFAAGQG